MIGNGLGAMDAQDRLKWAKIVKKVGEDGPSVEVESAMLLDTAERKCRDYQDKRTAEDREAGVFYCPEITVPPRGRLPGRRAKKPGRQKGRSR